MVEYLNIIISSQSKQEIHKHSLNKLVKEMCDVEGDNNKMRS